MNIKISKRNNIKKNLDGKYLRGEPFDEEDLSREKELKSLFESDPHFSNIYSEKLVILCETIAIFALVCAC